MFVHFISFDSIGVNECEKWKRMRSRRRRTSLERKCHLTTSFQISNDATKRHFLCKFKVEFQTACDKSHWSWLKESLFILILILIVTSVRWERKYYRLGQIYIFICHISLPLNNDEFFLPSTTLHHSKSDNVMRQVAERKKNEKCLELYLI